MPGVQINLFFPFQEIAWETYIIDQIFGNLSLIHILPTTREATDYLMANGVTFMPGKAANAGGVATSALEMCQNSARLSWTAEEVDTKLHQIMVDIFNKVDDASKRYGMEGNYVVGANIAGFEKVVDAMKAQGIV